MARNQGLALPFLAACVGIATFASMDVAMKGLALAMGAYNAMLWRTGAALLIALVLFLARPTPWPETATLRIHVWRGLIISLMAFLFFWGLIYIPLAEAIALTFIAPLIALYLSAVMLKEQVGRHSVLASLIGFLGGVIIIQGKLRGDYDTNTLLGILAVLSSALMYAYNLILQRQQALIAGPLEIALFQNAVVFLVYLLFAPFIAVLPGRDQLPLIGMAAVFGIVSVLLLSWAYGRAEARLLIPVEYTAFAWAALLGWWVFGEQLTSVTVLGTALIVTGCLWASRGARNPDHVETTAV